MYTENILYAINIGNSIEKLKEAERHFQKPFVVKTIQPRIILTERLIPSDKAPLHLRKDTQLIHRIPPRRVNGSWKPAEFTGCVSIIQEEIEELIIETPMESWSFDLTDTSRNMILHWIIDEVVSSLCVIKSNIDHLDKITRVLLDTHEPHSFDLKLTTMFLDTDEVHDIRDQMIAQLSFIFNDRYRDWSLVLVHNRHVLIGGADYRLKEWAELTGNVLEEAGEFSLGIESLVSQLRSLTPVALNKIAIQWRIPLVEYMVMECLGKHLKIPVTPVRIPKRSDITREYPGFNHHVKHVMASVVDPYVVVFIDAVLNKMLHGLTPWRYDLSLGYDPVRNTPTLYLSQNNVNPTMDDAESIAEDIEDQHYVPRNLRQRHGFA